MNTLQPFCLNDVFVLMLIVFGVMGGCYLPDDNTCHTGGKNCRIHYDQYHCFSSEETCKNFGGCGSVKFFAEPTKHCPEGNECRWKCCPLCSSSSAVLFDQKIAEEETSLTILNIEQTCDVITKGKLSPISHKDCQDLAIYRECKSFDFIQSEKDSLFSQCLLYECEECLLDLPYVGEEPVE